MSFLYIGLINIRDQINIKTISIIILEFFKTINKNRQTDFSNIYLRSCCRIVS